MAIHKESSEWYQELQELKVSSCSNHDTTVRQLVVDLDQAVNSMSNDLSDMWDRAVRFRVIARVANRTFIEMRCKVDEHIEVFDAILARDKTIGETASMRKKNPSLNENDGITGSETGCFDKVGECAIKDVIRQDLPSVADLQKTIQSLRKLQQLVETWLLAYSGELVVNPGSQDSITAVNNPEIVLSAKQHPKHLLSAIKQIQLRLYQLVPKWAKNLIYPNRKKDKGLAQHDDPLDGIESLVLGAIEMKGPAGHGMKEDRNVVNGMESLGIWFYDNEARLEQDDHIEGAFKLLEGDKEDRGDVDGVASLC